MTENSTSSIGVTSGSAATMPLVHRHRVDTPGLPENAAISLFEQLSALHPGAPAALLDSSDHAETSAPHRSRRSILAFSTGPHALEVRHRRGVTVEHRPGEADSPLRETSGEFFAWLADAWDHTGRPAEKTGHDDDGTDQPFQLGWVGWLGYELRREVGSPDQKPVQNPDPDQGPNQYPDTAQDEAHLLRATHAVVIDHGEETAEIQTLGEDPQWRERTLRLLDGLRAAHFESPSQPVAPAPTRRPPPALQPPPTLRNLRVRDDKAKYLTAIDAAQREIREGNTYEVCLTTAVTGEISASETSSPETPTSEISTIDLFRRLREANRAPFTQLLRLGAVSRGPGHPGVDVLSTSPERFLSIDADGLARSEPIKGTRPRAEDPAADEALKQDLASHPKDRAENVMITDLVRNDLSVHAVPGTLRTERLCAVESYPSVHQMVSTVSARIHPETSRADVVAAAFPPGSMTGAPKISTMDILQRLETGPRGPYSGVAGYFSTTGAADLSVLIRTLVISAGTQGGVRFHLGLGGAIVADSEPHAEWDEVVTKSAGVLGALGSAFPHT